MFTKADIPDDAYDTINRWSNLQIKAPVSAADASGDYYAVPTAPAPVATSTPPVIDFLRPGGKDFKGNVEKGTGAWRPNSTTPAAASYAIMQQQGIKLPPVPDRLRSGANQVKRMGDLSSVQKFKFSPDPATNTYLNVLASQYTDPNQGRQAIHSAYGRDFKLNDNDIKSMYTSSENQWQLPWRPSRFRIHHRHQTSRPYP